MFGLGVQELMIVGVIAVLLFGKRLPEVARSLGGSYREFKKGLAEFHTQVDFSSTSSSYSTKPKPRRSYEEYDDYDEATAPRFELPPPEPQTPSDNNPA